jgi:hypothetical protein
LPRVGVTPVGRGRPDLRTSPLIRCAETIMLFKISLVIILVATVLAAVVLIVGLVDTGRVNLAAFLVLWVVIGMAIPLWLIIRHGRN